ncbi:MAG TPA: hypothetical protein VIO94_12755 [Phenylobacterium sp.]
MQQPDTGPAPVATRSEDYLAQARACLAAMQAETLPGRRETLRASAQRWLKLSQSEVRVQAWRRAEALLHAG